MKPKSLLALAGMMALAGAAQMSPGSPDEPAGARSAKAARADAGKMTPNKSVDQRSVKGFFNSSGGNSRQGKIRAHGWPVATDRRRAKKARSIARNRAAHR